MSNNPLYPSVRSPTACTLCVDDISKRGFSQGQGVLPVTAGLFMTQIFMVSMVIPCVWCYRKFTRGTILEILGPYLENKEIGLEI